MIGEKNDAGYNHGITLDFIFSIFCQIRFIQKFEGFTPSEGI